MKKWAHWCRLAILLGVFLAPQAAQAQASWVAGAPLPAPQAGAAAVSHDGLVYVLGGANGEGAVVGTVVRYDPETDTWTTLPGLPEPVTNAAAVAYGGHILVVGGRDDRGRVVDEVQAFDLARSEWVEWARLNTEREGLSAAVLEDHIYAIGGSNRKEEILDSVERYDAESGEWEEYGAWRMDLARVSMGEAVAEGAIYTIGGFTPFGPVGRVQRYEPDEGTSQQATMIPARGALAAAALDGKVYAVGGRTANNEVIGTVGVYAPESNTWATGPALAVPRERHALVEVQGRLLAIGGLDAAGNALASVEVLSTRQPPEPRDDSATTAEDLVIDINVLENDENPGDGDLVVETFTQGASGTVTQPSADLLRYQPTANFYGQDTFTYTVRNDDGVAEASVTVTVQPVNDPPVFESEPELEGQEGELYAYEIEVEDVDGDELTVTAPVLPAWLTLATEDGQLVLRGTPGPGDAGSHTVELRVEDGVTSATQRYTVVVEPARPAVPTLLTPTDGATGQPTMLTLTWEAVPGAATYRVQVALDDTFTETVTEEDGLTAPFVEVEALAPETTYHWRVRAFNEAGNSDWSAPSAFTTQRPAPAAPTPLAPADEARALERPVELRWQAVAYADVYAVQVALDDAFTQRVFESSELGATELSVPDLQAGTTYVWRVQASNETGTSAWSTTYQFTTALAAPTAPALQTPAEGAQDVPVPVALTWAAAEDAASYTVQVASSDAFTVVEAEGRGLTTTAFEADLNGGQTYFWRVRARNASGAGPWSVVRTFMTALAAPAAPRLVSPEDEATDVSTAPTLAWSAAEGADEYRLQVATSEDFASLLFELTGLTAPGAVIDELDASTRYVWRVQAENAAGTSAWSAPFAFTTAADPAAQPATPTLTTPPNGAIEQPTTLTLGWNAAVNASTYEVQVAHTASFDGSVAGAAGLVTTSYGLDGLETGTVHYWRVRAVNEAGASSWSLPFSFETAAVRPEPPALTLPEAGAEDQPVMLTLRWEAAAGAATYRAQVARDAAFADVVAEESGITTTEVEVSGLDAGTTHYWRVQAVNTVGASDWSTTRAFTTLRDAVERPTAPALVIPADRAREVSLRPLLTWRQVRGAVTYEVQLALTDDFTAPRIDATALTDTTLEAAPLDPLTTYYWRVRAVNEGGAGPWSAVLVFTTRQATQTDTDETLPETVYIAANYPNPFSGSTTLAFEVPVAEPTRLVVYDVQGREVAVLVEGVLAAGRHEVRWSGTGAGGQTLPSGLYLARLVQGERQSVRTMVLVRQ